MNPEERHKRKVVSLEILKPHCISFTRSCLTHCTEGGTVPAPQASERSLDKRAAAQRGGDAEHV